MEAMGASGEQTGTASEKGVSPLGARKKKIGGVVDNTAMGHMKRTARLIGCWQRSRGKREKSRSAWKFGGTQCCG